MNAGSPTGVGKKSPYYRHLNTPSGRERLHYIVSCWTDYTNVFSRRIVEAGRMISEIDPAQRDGYNETLYRIDIIDKSARGRYNTISRETPVIAAVSTIFYLYAVLSILLIAYWQSVAV